MVIHRRWAMCYGAKIGFVGELDPGAGGILPEQQVLGGAVVVVGLAAVGQGVKQARRVPARRLQGHRRHAQLAQDRGEPASRAGGHGGGQHLLAQVLQAVGEQHAAGEHRRILPVQGQRDLGERRGDGALGGGLCGFFRGFGGLSRLAGIVGLGAAGVAAIDAPLVGTFKSGVVVGAIGPIRFSFMVSAHGKGVFFAQY